MITLFTLLSICFSVHAQQDLTNVPWSDVKQQVERLVNTSNNIKELNLAIETFGQRDFISVMLDDLDGLDQIEGNTAFAFATYVGDTKIMKDIVDLTIKSVLIEDVTLTELMDLEKKMNQNNLQKAVNANQALQVLSRISRPNFLGTTPLMLATMNNKKEAISLIISTVSFLSEVAEDKLDKDFYKKFLLTKNINDKNALILAVCQDKPDINLISILIKEIKSVLDKKDYYDVIKEALNFKCAKKQEVICLLNKETL